MKIYAKLISPHNIDILKNIPYILNPSEESLMTYALENGYKELITSENQGTYYSKTYIEKGETIIETWEPWSLDSAKNDALSQVQNNLDNARNTRVTIPCDGIEAGIFCDQDARLMATGLVAMGTNIPEGMTWTDADDNVHNLTPELLAAISKAFVSYLLIAQHKADETRSLIKAATDVDMVEAALKSIK